MRPFRDKKPQHTTKVNGGIGFLGLLTILFIALKLIGVISWNWFYVVLPILAPALLVVAIFVLLVLIYIGAEIFEYLIEEE